MTLRADARANRDRIVAAAREVFREAGVEAPLDLVAKRAGVGRATLYRNFPDRSALVAYLLAERMGDLEEMVAGRTDADVFEDLVRVTCREELRLPGLAAAMASMRKARHPAMAAITARSDRLYADALRRSAAAGRLRADLADEDGPMIAAMVHQAIQRTTADPMADAERALALLVDGIRSVNARPYVDAVSASPVSSAHGCR